MKKYIIILIIIGLLVLILAGVLIWYNYQKTERKYQACLAGCRAEYSEGIKSYLYTKDVDVCGASCREKYAK